MNTTLYNSIFTKKEFLLQSINSKLYNKEILFDKAVKEKGGIFITDNPQLNFKLNYYKTEAIHMLQRMHIPFTDIYFINNPNFNALATINKHIDFIGINLGTIFIIEDLFFRMMSHPQILPSVGDVSKENAKKIFNAKIVNAEQLLIAKPYQEAIQPNDQTRYFFAISLAKNAFLYIILHELGHLYSGHLHYVKNYSNNLMVVESNDIDYKKLSELDYQTLELDADSYSLNNCIKYLLALGNNQNIIKNNFVSFFKTPYDITFNMCFSVQSIFTLYDINDYNPESFGQLKHPPIGIRQKHMALFLCQILEMIFGKQDIEKFWDAVALGSGDSMQAFDFISESPVNHANFVNSFKEEIDKQHLDKILYNWQYVRPTLAKYSRIKLAPMPKVDNRPPIYK